MKCKDCPYLKDNSCKDAIIYGFCPNLDEEDYGTRLAKEIQEQNDSYTIEKSRNKKTF